VYSAYYEGTVPQVSDIPVGGEPLIYRTKKRQVHWCNLPEAFLSEIFKSLLSYPLLSHFRLFLVEFYYAGFILILIGSYFFQNIL